ncbi:hypothetical protein A3709_19765 [Halioglobus sp. HI00S01]|uniref:chemotaxis protein CheW n=1 Tax=Halioglobus sp. HI00S01 TaxID=1822214 RepID=UPI0007C1FE1F|nr:chemotaxis protein CheW [Halioglobus sp. HI00S01]KZX57864.1 hypothetical protein A3709_19765 [Halioglobus sp. HI00S01]
MDVARDQFELLSSFYETGAAPSPKGKPPELTWYGTEIAIAGTPILVDGMSFDEVIEIPSLTPVPGTKPWASGVASHKGAVLPFVDGDIFLHGEAGRGKRREYALVVSRPGYHFALTLSKVMGGRELLLEKRVDSIPKAVAPAGIHRFCVGGYERDDAFLPVLDLDKLVADADFGSAAASTSKP